MMIDSSFVTRVKSMLVVVPVVLVALWAGGVPFAALMIFAMATSLYEWVRLVNSQARLVVFGAVYIGLAFAAMLWLRLGTDQGLYNFLLLLFIVWGSDTCAYISGRAIGGAKLAPSISPKKTWAGFWGSSVGAGIIAAGFACPVVLEYFNLTSFGGLSYCGLVVAGFVLAMFGQAGDLFISIFKRHFGVKDTGTLIPGHGGILDRIDALLLVSILFAALARSVGL